MNWKTTWGLLTNILERINGPLIKPNVGKICVMILLNLIKSFNRGLDYLKIFIKRLKTLKRVGEADSVLNADSFIETLWDLQIKNMLN